jgi:hypothetical protein
LLFKGYVTTAGSIGGKSNVELARALGFAPGSLNSGYEIYRLVEPVYVNEFDWRDRTRYSAGWHIDPTIRFGSDPNARWAVQRRDELRAALGKQNNYNEKLTDAAIERILGAELQKLNVRSGPGAIVKLRPKNMPSGFPDSPYRNIPQWELKVSKSFKLI